MIYQGDCLEGMKRLADNSVDAIVTDPPYGLSKEPDMAEVLRHWLNGDDYAHPHKGFMGKAWDSFVPGPTVWRECLRVLKPGGHLLAFFGTRFIGFELDEHFHRIAMARWLAATNEEDLA